jgi:arsenate reductase
MKEGRNILKIIFYSAGVIAQGSNTRAVRVMKETGVDISHHFYKDIKSLIDISFDHVITVCSHAKQLCLKFPGKTHVTHVSL